jgi:hypothetical protein
VLEGGRRISGLPILTFLAPGVNIFSPAEKIAKKCDSSTGALLPIDRWHRGSRLGGRALRFELRYRDAVGRQKPAETSVLFP